MILIKLDNDKQTLTKEDGTIILDNVSATEVTLFLALEKSALVDRKRALLSQVADTITQLRELETIKVI